MNIRRNTVNERQVQLLTGLCTSQVPDCLTVGNQNGFWAEKVLRWRCWDPSQELPQDETVSYQCSVIRQGAQNLCVLSLTVLQQDLLQDIQIPCRAVPSVQSLCSSRR